MTLKTILLAPQAETKPAATTRDINFTGRSGNCYYMDNGNKVSVESHECNC